MAYITLCCVPGAAMRDVKICVSPLKLRRSLAGQKEPCEHEVQLANWWGSVICDLLIKVANGNDVNVK